MHRMACSVTSKLEIQQIEQNDELDGDEFHEIKDESVSFRRRNQRNAAVSGNRKVLA